MDLLAFRAACEFMDVRGRLRGERDVWISVISESGGLLCMGWDFWLEAEWVPSNRPSRLKAPGIDAAAYGEGGSEG